MPISLALSWLQWWVRFMALYYRSAGPELGEWAPVMVRRGEVVVELLAVLLSVLMVVEPSAKVPLGLPLLRVLKGAMMGAVEPEVEWRSAG